MESTGSWASFVYLNDKDRRALAQTPYERIIDQFNFGMNQIEDQPSGFNRSLPPIIRKARVRINVEKHPCIICFDPCTTSSRCCNVNIHQECLQEWIDTKPLYLCPQRCGGLSIEE